MSAAVGGRGFWAMASEPGASEAAESRMAKTRAESRVDRIRRFLIGACDGRTSEALRVACFERDEPGTAGRARNFDWSEYSKLVFGRSRCCPDVPSCGSGLPSFSR